MLIGISGMVGTGKTTLARALAERFGLRAALESVDEDNPWLEPYYAEPDGMHRYGFELQLHFLASRMRHLRAMRRQGGSWVIDRTFYEDAEIFARRLHDQGQIGAAHWGLYRALYDELCQLPAAEPPTLLTHLHGPLEVVVERIRARGRPSERAVAVEYWSELHRRYAEWIEHFDLAPVVRIDIREYDLHPDPGAAVTRIAQRVREDTGIELTELSPPAPRKE